MWWVRDIFQGQNECCRPDMIRFEHSRNIEMSGVFVTNSPRYHIVLKDCENVEMHDFEIYVDVWGQLSLQKFYGGVVNKSFEKYRDLSKIDLPNLSIEAPIFPLNTDAIDTWARNVTFRRLKITNFDDAVVPKPCN
jgi:polygalacturonase